MTKNRLYENSDIENLAETAERITQQEKGEEQMLDEFEVKKTLTDMGYSEEIVNRVLDGYKTEKENSKTQKNKGKSLDSEVLKIVKGDIQKIGRGLKIAGKVIAYPVLGNLGIPTMFRKTYDYYKESEPLPNAVIGSAVSLFFSVSTYALLSKHAPETIPYVAAVQGTTNFASGIYEWIRSIKKRAQKED